MRQLPALRVAFREVMATLEFDDDVRAVVITGAGQHFMAGGISGRWSTGLACRTPNVV